MRCARFRHFLFLEIFFDFGTYLGIRAFKGCSILHVLADAVAVGLDLRWSSCMDSPTSEAL
jgi:hypothetical protein